VSTPTFYPFSGGSTLHNLPTEEHSLFSSLEYNIRMGSGLATVQSAREPVVQADADHSSGPVAAAADGQKKRKKIVKKKRKPQKGQTSPAPNQAETPPPQSSQNNAGNIGEMAKAVVNVTNRTISSRLSFPHTPSSCSDAFPFPLLLCCRRRF
jgi:hypothetical protein